MKVKLPFPPSVNHYWGVRGKKRYVKPECKLFRDETFLACRNLETFGTDLIVVDIVVTYPDNRRRDLDNLLKAPLDALQIAGIYEDDSQIRKVMIEYNGVCSPGCLDITIESVS